MGHNLDRITNNFRKARTNAPQKKHFSNNFHQIIDLLSNHKNDLVKFQLETKIRFTTSLNSFEQVQTKQTTEWRSSSFAINFKD